MTERMYNLFLKTSEAMQRHMKKWKKPIGIGEDGGRWHLHRLPVQVSSHQTELSKNM